MSFKANDDDDDTSEESSEVSETTSEQSESESDSESVNAAEKTTDAEKITLLNSMVRNSKVFDKKLFLQKMETIEQVPESLHHAQLK